MNRKIEQISYYFPKLTQLYSQLYIKARIVRLQGTQKTMDQDWLENGDFLSDLEKILVMNGKFYSPISRRKLCFLDSVMIVNRISWTKVRVQSLVPKGFSYRFSL